VYEVPVDRASAAEVETRCLEGLRWRLGPYFAADDMTYGRREASYGGGGVKRRAAPQQRD